MTKTYLSYVFGLCPQLLTHSPPTPWTFLSFQSDKVVFCFVNEVTFGRHLRVGTVCQWTQPCDEKVRTFSPTALSLHSSTNPQPMTLGRGRRLEAESIFSGQRFNQS